MSRINGVQLLIGLAGLAVAIRDEEGGLEAFDVSGAGVESDRGSLTLNLTLEPRGPATVDQGPADPAGPELVADPPAAGETDAPPRVMGREDLPPTPAPPAEVPTA